MRCLFWHDWGPWVLLRAWEMTLEEWRICQHCGKSMKGDSWRVADREALVGLHESSMGKEEHYGPIN